MYSPTYLALWTEMWDRRERIDELEEEMYATRCEERREALRAQVAELEAEQDVTVERLRATGE